MRPLIFILATALLWNITFVEKSFAGLFVKPNCIVAIELNDLDFNDVNRSALKQAISDLGYQSKEFFIDNKDKLSNQSSTLSAFRLLDYGPRPGINEDAPYVGQSEIALIVPKSTVVDHVHTPTKMIYEIKVYFVKKASWTVTADDLDNKSARFFGEIEKVSEPIEIGKRFISPRDKLPGSCDLFGKARMDVVDPTICAKMQITEPVTSKAELEKQLAPFLNYSCRAKN